MSDASDDIPIGTIVASAAEWPPNDDYLLCNGATIPIGSYPALAAAIGNTYNPFPPADYFTLPDCRGRFLRGATDQVVLGTYQDYGTGCPSNPFRGTVSHIPTDTVGSHGETDGGKAEVHGSKTIATCTEGGDAETRPVNIYVQYFIKARDGDLR